MPAGSQQNSFLSSIATQWAGNDPQAAELTWVKSLATAKQKTTPSPGWFPAGRKILRATRQTTPPLCRRANSGWHRAIRWCPPGRLPNQKKLRNGRDVSRRRGAGKGRARVVNTWLNNDPEGAAMARNFAGRQTARASSRGLRQPNLVFESGARRALDGINRQRATRWNQMENLARNWMRVDPNAARAWLSNTSLPDPRKQRLLQQNLESN